jgi:CRISPR/Cas system-associated endoribonuclease Cas2
MSMPPTPHRAGLARGTGLPYLFAYDIPCNRRRRRVLRCLRRWRVDGQLSVHETWLRPVQARELAAELLDLVDREADKLLACRLDRRGGGPVYRLFGPSPHSPLAGPAGAQPLPSRLHDGWYLLAYDIADERRLTRVQRATRRRSLFLQRSVYLFQGAGRELGELLDEVADLMHRRKDDLRVYALAGPADLWFLSGEVPPLPALQRIEEGRHWWRRLLAWIGA